MDRRFPWKFAGSETSRPLRPRFLRSEPQPGVVMPAFGAAAELRAGRGGIKCVAPDAVKHGLPPLEFKAAVIPAVIIQPEPEKNYGHQHTVDYGGRSQVEHQAEFVESACARQARSAVRSRQRDISRATTVATRPKKNAPSCLGALGSETESGTQLFASPSDFLVSAAGAASVFGASAAASDLGALAFGLFLPFGFRLPLDFL
jgi:hypothetical protein